MIEKLPSQGILIGSPVYSSPGSQIRIQITPWTLKKIKIISGFAYWDKEKLFYEYNRETKISWLCPFNSRATNCTDIGFTKQASQEHKRLTVCNTD
jgi:hypothetical protein